MIIMTIDGKEYIDASKGSCSKPTRKERKLSRILADCKESCDAKPLVEIDEKAIEQEKEISQILSDCNQSCEFKAVKELELTNAEKKFIDFLNDLERSHPNAWGKTEKKLFSRITEYFKENPEKVQINIVTEKIKLHHINVANKTFTLKTND